MIGIIGYVNRSWLLIIISIVLLLIAPSFYYIKTKINNYCHREKREEIRKNVYKKM